MRFPMRVADGLAIGGVSTVLDMILGSFHSNLRTRYSGKRVDSIPPRPGSPWPTPIHITTICDVGELNDEDQDRLRELLRTADAREMYLDWMNLHADLVLRDDSAATEAAGLFSKTEHGYKSIVEDSCFHDFDWLHVEQFDDVAIVHLMEPSLKRDSSLDPRQELLEFLKKTKTRKVVISLRSVTYLTSNTLNLLLRARDHFTTREGEIRLANVSEDMREVLAFLNLDGGYAFQIHDSTEAALKALRSD